MKLEDLKAELSKLDLSKFDGVLLGKSKVLDAKKFVETEIEYLEANKGNPTFKPYYDRLLLFYQTISNEK